MRTLLLPDHDAVDVALAGFARASSRWVELHERPAYVTGRLRDPARRVGLVSGGGSGHEPLHAGFVGLGMLDAAVPGKVFASPHNRQVLEASLAVAGPEGVLHVVKNYTGDKINFGIAAERLRDHGVAVERVLVDDDVATENDEVATGRRGTAATMIVEKVLGAAADTGCGLVELAGIGRDVAGRARSIAVATRAQTSAASGGEAFAIDPSEIEYGVGIHGERAVETVPRPPLEELVGRMVDDVVSHLPTTEGRLLLLVNGMGAATSLELHAAAELAGRELESRSLPPAAVKVGTFVPGLDMSGFSLTLAALEEDEWAWWNAPVDTPAWTSASEKETR